MFQALLKDIYRCYVGRREEHIVFCLQKNCLQASWPIGKVGGKEDFKEKEQEVQRHIIHLVYSKYMGDVLRR